MRLSIIVPIYNSEGTLRRCLDSLLRQNIDEDFEILCVDDGSYDNSLQILEEYKRVFPHIFFVFRQEHLGVAAARNLGLKHSNGDIVAFCDSDDYLIDGAYGFLLERFWDDQVEVLTFGALTVDRYAICQLDSLNKLTGEVIYQGSGRKYYWEKGYHFSCCFHLIRRSFIIDHYLYFDSLMIGEDVLFCLKLHLCDPYIRQVSCCLYRYMVHSNQTIAKRTPEILKRMLNDYLLVFAAFHHAGLDKYNRKELVPMTSRLLMANLSQREYYRIVDSLRSLKVIPFIGINRIDKAILFIFKGYISYYIAGVIHRSLVVPFVLPRLHRNAGI